MSSNEDNICNNDDIFEAKESERVNERQISNYSRKLAVVFGDSITQQGYINLLYIF